MTAAALAVDAAVHPDLAPDYHFAPAPTHATVFRVEAAAACLAAFPVLRAGRRFAVWAFAFLVSASALGAVLPYSHVDVGALGPVPNMYDPVCYPQK
ncbi:hypothetical protein VM98_37385, partial [Streptomyces rubellomurinus subsp. indigoferus]